MTGTSSHTEEVPGFRARRSERVPLDGEVASLNPGQVYAVEIRIANLSPTGFMAECAEPVLIGSYVSLEVPGVGPVEAQVRWQIGPKMGGMFLDPIRLARCEWAAAKAQAA
jgi:hypothetical protein